MFYPLGTIGNLKQRGLLEPFLVGNKLIDLQKVLSTKIREFDLQHMLMTSIDREAAGFYRWPNAYTSIGKDIEFRAQELERLQTEGKLSAEQAYCTAYITEGLNGRAIFLIEVPEDFNSTKFEVTYFDLSEQFRNYECKHKSLSS